MLESDYYCQSPAYKAIEDFEKAMDNKLDELCSELGIDIISQDYL
jgi:hypothetical protein